MNQYIPDFPNRNYYCIYFIFLPKLNASQNIKKKFLIWRRPYNILQCTMSTYQGESNLTHGLWTQNWSSTVFWMVSLWRAPEYVHGMAISHSALNSVYSNIVLERQDCIFPHLSWDCEIHAYKETLLLFIWLIDLFSWVIRSHAVKRLWFCDLCAQCSVPICIFLLGRLLL